MHALTIQNHAQIFNMSIIRVKGKAHTEGGVKQECWPHKGPLVGFSHQGGD